MAFKPEKGKRELVNLKAVLQQSDIQIKDNALYQVINQLIDKLSENQRIETGITNEISSDLGILLKAIVNLRLHSYLTEQAESELPNSRQLLAGTNVSFDDTVSGERTINATGGGGSGIGYWTLITDGDSIEPEFIFANGKPIVAFVPGNE